MRLTNNAILVNFGVASWMTHVVLCRVFVNKQKVYHSKIDHHSDPLFSITKDSMPAKSPRSPTQNNEDIKAAKLAIEDCCSVFPISSSPDSYQNAQPS